jgi:hypothetical protein
MEKQQSNRSRIIGLRLTPQEYTEIRVRFNATTNRKLSDYVRHVLLDGTVTIRTRDQSVDDFMAEMILLRNQLQAAGNNLNQAVHKLHTFRDSADVLGWLFTYQAQVTEFFRKVEEIKLKINQFADRW